MTKTHPALEALRNIEEHSAEETGDGLWMGYHRKHWEAAAAAIPALEATLAQRDELLAALEQVLPFIANDGVARANGLAMAAHVRNVIAKAKVRL